MKPEITAAVFALVLNGCAAQRTAEKLVEEPVVEIDPVQQQLLREYQQRPIGVPIFKNKLSFLGMDLGRVGWHSWHGENGSFFTLKAESNIDARETVSYLTSRLTTLKETYSVNDEDISSLEKFVTQSSENIRQIRIDVRYKKGQREGAVLIYENDDSSSESYLRGSTLMPTPLVLSIYHYSIPIVTGKSHFFGRILDHYIIKNEGKLDFFKEHH